MLDDDLDNDPELLEAFFDEASEHIGAIEQGIIALEADAGDHDTVDALFRSYHTIKGAAAMLSLDGFQRIAHSAEQLLLDYRENRRGFQSEHSDLLLASVDLLKGLAANPSDQALRSKIDLLVAELDRASSEQGQEDPLPMGDEKSPSAPAAKVTKKPEEPQQNVYIAPKDSFSQLRDSTVRVPVERLDRLVDMIGELVIAESMIDQWIQKHVAVDDSERSQINRLNKITRELQEVGTSLRMVPVRPVFNRMARLVRDLAQKLGKPIQFVPSGEDTLLDKSVVDRIVDPLLHLVRNAADHGIESPDQRRESGKDKAGTISLEAFHRAGSIYIRLSDDGRGIDRDKVAKRAIALGLIESAEGMTDREVLDLIFEAGFSTAESVTDVSGRGVGMDVVKRDIHSLRGVVDVDSTLGQGTVFSIRLPLTLAIIDGMLVRIGEERYIIPILSIKSSLRPQYDQVYSVLSGGCVMKHLGRLVPVYPLHALFNVADAVTEPARGIVVVVEEDGREAGILVDELLGQQQFVIKSLGSANQDMAGLSGAAVMADGQVGLILDVPGLIKLAHFGNNDFTKSLASSSEEGAEP